MGYEHDLHGRLGRAVRLWREATGAPLPRLPQTEPGTQVTTLELELVNLLAKTATPDRAADVRFQLAELTEGLSSDDPVSRRVEDLLPALCRLEERRAQRGGPELPLGRGGGRQPG